MSINDLWFGERITNMANSYRPEYIDVTSYNPDSQLTRTTTMHRDRWMKVEREM